MLEVKTFKISEKERKMECGIHGTVMELCEDTLSALRQIWKNIDRNSHGASAIFACCITDAVKGKGGYNLFCAPEGEVEIGVKISHPEEAGPS